MSKRKIINQWKSFFQNHGILENLQFQYLAYIERLLNNNVPIIFDFIHLALLLGRKTDYLASVVNSSNNHFREFKIRKRSGGYRLITSPYPALLEMQYWIFHNILKKIRVNSSAHGFVNKKSIITNAKLHAGQKELLKIDLCNFFPSIGLNRIIFVFKSVGYPNNIAFYLAAICSYEKHLPQGAPTSPILSNIISKNLDNRLVNLSKKLNLKYSRYADDLTFSGENLPVKIISYISSICSDEGFQINKQKTRLYKNDRKKIVTGINVSKEQLKIPREYKRSLKQELHYIFKYGLNSHVSKKRIRSANYLFSILGKVNYWLNVEPENIYAQEAKKKTLDMIVNAST